MTNRSGLMIAGITGALGVAIGAFGAHSLPGYLDEQALSAADLERRLEVFETGARYHMFHAVALLAIAGFREKQHGPALCLATYAWLLGIAIFSGCLYALALTGIRILGAIVPIGGVAFIIGWLSLCWGTGTRPSE